MRERGQAASEVCVRGACVTAGYEVRMPTASQMAAALSECGLSQYAERAQTCVAALRLERAAAMLLLQEAGVKRGHAGKFFSKIWQPANDAPDPNAAAFRVADDGRWLRTGDRGAVDDAGYLSLRGRAARLLSCGGERVSPPEVEDSLRRHPCEPRFKPALRS